jgi:hypothetical protein
MAFTWFFTKITVAIQGLLWFHMDLRIVFPVSVQNDIGVLIDRIESADLFERLWTVKQYSSNPGALNVLPVIFIYFHFFYQCTVVFRAQPFTNLVQFRPT